MKDKMKCRETKNNLIAYIEGSLPIDLVQDMELHLKECSACNMLFNEVKATYNSFELIEKPQLNPYIYNKIESKLRHKKHIPDILPRYTILTKIAASFLVLVGISIGIFIGGKMEISTSESTTATQNELLEAYASEYRLDDSGLQVLESILTNE